MTPALRLALVAAISLTTPACRGLFRSAEPALPTGTEDPLEVRPIPSDAEREDRVRREAEAADADLPEPEERAESGRVLPSRPARPTVQPRPFRIADLPLAALPPPLDEARAPTTLPASAPAPELSIDHSGDVADLTLRLGRGGIGRIQIGGPDSPSSAGLRVGCGARRRTMAPARWEILERTPGARPRLLVVDAWFDAGTCRASVVRRSAVDLAPVLGQLLFAFRECAASCEAREAITIVGPALTQVNASAQGAIARKPTVAPFGRVTLELARGGGSSLAARVAPHALDAWYAGRPPAWASGLDGLLVGVDITQSVDEEEPVGVAYVGRLARR